jgi:predicted dehydrogenase
VTIKGSKTSRRISDFYIDALSDGGPFTELGERPSDPRASSLKAQLDDLLLCIEKKPNRLATLEEALRVQKLVETMLAGKP